MRRHWQQDTMATPLPGLPTAGWCSVVNTLQNALQNSCELQRSSLSSFLGICTGHKAFSSTSLIRQQSLQSCCSRVANKCAAACSQGSAADVHSCLSSDYWTLCPSAENVSQRSTLSRHKTEAVYTGIKARHKMVQLTAKGSMTCLSRASAHYTALECRRGCGATSYRLFRLSCL